MTSWLWWVGYAELVVPSWFCPGMGRVDSVKLVMTSWLCRVVFTELVQPNSRRSRAELNPYTKINDFLTVISVILMRICSTILLWPEIYLLWTEIYWYNYINRTFFYYNFLNFNVIIVISTELQYNSANVYWNWFLKFF